MGGVVSIVRSKRHPDLLRRAAYDGNVETVEDLLAKGVDKDTRGQFGYTALMAAAMMGHTSIVLLLLNKGADLEARNGVASRGENALLLAATFGHTYVAKLLLDKGADIEARNRQGYTAVMKAAEAGHADLVMQLADRGANLNAQDRYGYTAADLARQGPTIGGRKPGHDEVYSFLSSHTC